MKKLFIIGNWKSNKTEVEGIDWFEKWKEYTVPNNEEKTIIICPSFTLLSEIHFFINKNNLPISLGSQDISPFAQGAYTGAINGIQIKEFCFYTIIGHSERRRNFNESDAILAKKVTSAKENGLFPIYCVQGKEDAIPQGVEIVAYEPITSIGTGIPDSPENANAIAEAIRKKNPHVQYILYGGSVTPENVHSFTSQLLINGVLVGGASLDSETFYQLTRNA